jgi:hypothetical protein
MEALATVTIGRRWTGTRQREHRARSTVAELMATDGVWPAITRRRIAASSTELAAQSPSRSGDEVGAKIKTDGPAFVSK